MKSTGTKNNQAMDNAALNCSLAKFIYHSAIGTPDPGKQNEKLPSRDRQVSETPGGGKEKGFLPSRVSRSNDEHSDQEDDGEGASVSSSTGQPNAEERDLTFCIGDVIGYSINFDKKNGSDDIEDGDHVAGLVKSVARDSEEGKYQSDGDEKLKGMEFGAFARTRILLPPPA